MLNNLSKIYLVANYTFREIIKSRILVNVAMLGAVTFLVTFVAYQFTYGEASRIALDFGMGTLSLSSIAIAIFIGVGLLSKEIESRTVYMIISRPVPRSCFILGKILGLSAILTLNVFLLSLVSLSLYFFIGGEFNNLILWSILFTCLESLIVLLIVSMLSLVTSNTMSVLVSIMIYISGHAISEAKLLSFTKQTPGLTEILGFYHYVLPGFYKLNIKEFLLYEQNLSLQYLFGTAGYGICYSLVLVLINIYIFERKNLD